MWPMSTFEKEIIKKLFFVSTFLDCYRQVQRNRQVKFSSLMKMRYAP